MRASILAAAVLCTVGGIAQAQTYPAKTVRIIVPFTTGGGSDFIARTIAPPVSKAMGQQFVVDNRPGAGSTLGSEINKAIKDPDFAKRIAQDGLEPAGGTPEVFGELLKREVTEWGEVVKAANVKAE